MRFTTTGVALAEDAPERPRDAPQRTGIFTSGVISTKEGRTIALYFTGRKHAGENLAEVLARRAAALGPPIQMCDAPARWMPRNYQEMLAPAGTTAPLSPTPG